MLSSLRSISSVAAPFAALLGAGLAVPAQAATIVDTANFDFTLYDVTKTTLRTGPFASVQVNQMSNGALSFLITPASDTRFHITKNTNHEAFAFNLAGDTNLSITDLTAGFTARFTTAGTDISEVPFGTFETGISCDNVKSGGACGPGFDGGYAGPLSFTVMRSNGIALTLADLQSTLYNAQNVFFTMDVVMRDVYGQVFTGNLGAIQVQGSVPEPEAWLTMILGFGVLGATMRRRNAIAYRGRRADLA